MRTPKYRRHSTRDVALVEIRGKRFYLPGPFNSAESRAAYRKLLREHVFIDPEPMLPGPAPVTVAHIVAAFLRDAKARYPDGSNSEYHNCRIACGKALKLFAMLPAIEFGPRKLKEVREHIVTENIGTDEVPKRVSASHCNAQISRIKRAFRWAVSEELIPASVSHGLETVSGLKSRKTRRQPVPWDHVASVIEYLREPVRSMVLFQWHTGCRADSVCNAIRSQFSTAGDVWEWRPKHKTQHLGVELVLPIGPQCQEILRPFLTGPDDGYLFTPRSVRKSRRYRTHYDTHSYRQAIERAIVRANDARAAMDPPLPAIPPWSPHQLRHAKGHAVRDKYGIEAAQAVLGHGSLEATQVYSARQLKLAKQVARETG